MDAQGLLNALVAFYADRSEWTRVSAADLLIHAASVVRDIDEETATEWVSETLTDIRADKG